MIIEFSQNLKQSPSTKNIKNKNICGPDYLEERKKIEQLFQEKVKTEYADFKERFLKKTKKIIFELADMINFYNFLLSCLTDLEIVEMFSVEDLKYLLDYPFLLKNLFIYSIEVGYIPDIMDFLEDFIKISKIRKSNKNRESCKNGTI